MKKIANNIWTDGEHQYKGNPRDGFTKLDGDLRNQIIERIKEPAPENVVEMEAHNLQQPKKEVDTESEE